MHTHNTIRHVDPSCQVEWFLVGEYQIQHAITFATAATQRYCCCLLLCTATAVLSYIYTTGCSHH